MKYTVVIGNSCGLMVEKSGSNRLILTVDLSDIPFLEALSRDKIIEAIEDTNKVSKDLSESDAEYDVEKIDIPDSFDVLDEDEPIYASFSSDLKSYLEANPILLNYEIRITDEFDITPEDFNEVYSQLKDFKNIKVRLSGNSYYCSLEDYQYTLDCIKQYSNLIKEYDLSPMEQIMFAYDLVRSRIYKVEEENEDLGESRDITKILKGNKIVCVGFQQLFSKILDQLGIKNTSYEIVRKSNDKIGHVRSRILVDDDKYNIHGIYFFDPTWDGKSREDDKLYVDKYTYFALNTDQMNRVDENKYNPISQVLTSDLVSEINKFLKTRNLDDIDNKTLSKIKRVFYGLFEFPEFDNIFSRKIYTLISQGSSSSDNAAEGINFEELQDLITKAFNYYNPEEIDPSTIIDIFERVRKIESYIMPETYSYSEKDFKYLALNLAKITKEEWMLYTIFEKTSKSIEKLKELEKKNSDKNIPLEEQRINLARVLRKVYESKR